MEQNKGLGGSLIDVFDAAVNLIKTEAGVLTKRATDVIKAKGIGVVLLLAATAPLTLGLIFIILALFYGLMRLGLGAWAAALFIALASFGMAGLLVVIGLGRLSAKVKDDETAESYDLKTPYTQQAGELRDDDTIVAGRASVPQGQQVGRVQEVHLHGAAKVEGVRGGKEDIVPTAPLAAGKNAGEGSIAERSGTASSTVAHNPQHQKHGNNDAGPHVPDKSKSAPAGISVSTEPTYKDDMKKEGY
ncbi:phage holin family protein [Deinococcus detaillensis]|uniref:Phage holin family protein n=1 Tax=Deinococcus detaillensis TaxID=2592048 RepID=A0A553V0S0_9DEIO|nr:phage holin family protein [Deinococcus detaillensis]TSA86058.1 phage holin family protein [Deinococcus detaillensis]